MTSIFNLNDNDDIDDNFSEKINLDELYEKKKNYDLNKLSIFKSYPYLLGLDIVVVSATLGIMLDKVRY